jgi:probable F420-dependent oxidoreductase
LGFDHLIAYDHLLGADDRGPYAHRQGRPYSYRDQFLEPFLLFAHLAAVTTRLNFMTGVLVLGQRQTALVAKQAAVLDVLTGGRLRLGVGTGWNDVEYEALGEGFRNRGARSEEQIEVLRALWTNDVVSYEGRWHKITAAGVNPLPVQRPIPIWIGGSVEAVFKRAGRIADGWIATGRFGVGEQSRGAIETVRTAASEAGRDPASVGIEGIVNLSDLGLDAAAAAVGRLRDIGADSASLMTMNTGLKTPDDHIEIMRRWKEGAGI